MAALLGREVLTKDYETVRIRIAFHPQEETFEVANPAIRKDVAWIEDVAEVFAPDASLTELTDAYAEKNPGADRKRVFAGAGEAPQDHQQPRRRDRAGRRPRHRDRHRDLHPRELRRRRALPGRLRHVEDRRQRDLRRQPAAQGHRLLLPPGRRAGVPGAHREGRQGLRRLRVPAADALAQGRQRRHLRPDLHRHAARGVHLGVRARQAAGPRGAALGPQLRDQAVSRRPSPRSPSRGSRRASSPSSTRRTSTASR